MRKRTSQEPRRAKAPRLEKSAAGVRPVDELGRAALIPLIALLLLAAVAVGCSPVRFNQRQRLGEAAMQFDPNPMAAEMQGKVLTSREASVGGFNGSAVGGCGCN